MSLSCQEGKVGGQGEGLAKLGWAEEHQHAPVQALSVSWNDLLPCLCKQLERGGAVCCQSCEHTSLQLVQGRIVLLHRRTGGHQANGLLRLACIYLYGVNSEPQFRAVWGEQALRCTAVWLSPASQHHCSKVLLLSPLLGEQSLEVSVQGGL